MKHLSQDKKKKIFSIIILFVWCFLIFYFSNQNGYISEINSDKVIIFLNNIFNFFKISIDFNSLENISLIIRKLAHMFLYFILFLLAYNVSYQFKFKRKILISFIFCLLYAISDEIHQLFIFERSGQIIDVIIDTIGASFGILLLIIKRFFKSNKL